MGVGCERAAGGEGTAWPQVFVTMQVQKVWRKGAGGGKDGRAIFHRPRTKRRSQARAGVARALVCPEPVWPELVWPEPVWPEL
eukprot:310865-Chlamydomonas_euryale.AAC.1